mgnify:CR=1 FL=1
MTARAYEITPVPDDRAVARAIARALDELARDERERPSEWARVAVEEQLDCGV